MTNTRLSAMAGLYGPSAGELTNQLPDIADRLQAQLYELARAPEPDRCELMATRLNGAARFVMQLREATQRAHEKGPAAGTDRA